MCIRDSILSEHGRELPAIQLALQVGTVIPHLTAEVLYGEPGSPEQVFEAVSYTHLDVYKRQGITTVCIIH